jgi:AraC-type transcriptional regulator
MGSTNRDIHSTIRDTNLDSGMPDLIRAASLKHYADVARSVGLDPGAMLKRVELAPAALLDPDIRIRGEDVRKLLEASTAEAGVEDFGLRLAERGGLSNLGPVALIVRVQETVGSAIEAMARYIHIHNESMSVRIVRHGDTVSIVPALAIGRPVPARQSVLLLIGVVYRIIAAFMGANWHPLGVHFAQPTPRRRDTYRRFFNCNVVFGAEYDAILMLREDLERPMPSGDAALARYAREYVEGIAARSPEFEGKVLRLRPPAYRSLLDRTRGGPPRLRPTHGAPPTR